MSAELWSCGGCVFFQLGGVVKDGQCRRDPPGVYVFSGDVEWEGEDGDVLLCGEVSYVGWPEVELQDWCGGFVSRTNPQ